MNKISQEMLSAELIRAWQAIQNQNIDYDYPLWARELLQADLSDNLDNFTIEECLKQKAVGEKTKKSKADSTKNELSNLSGEVISDKVKFFDLDADEQPSAESLTSADSFSSAELFEPGDLFSLKGIQIERISESKTGPENRITGENGGQQEADPRIRTDLVNKGQFIKDETGKIIGIDSSKIRYSPGLLVNYCNGRRDVYPYQYESISKKTNKPYKGWSFKCSMFWQEGCLKKKPAAEEAKNSSINISGLNIKNSNNKAKIKNGGQKDTCLNCPVRTYQPLNQEAVVNHLKPVNFKYEDSKIGIYPLLEDGTCYFLAFDFDSHDADSMNNIKRNKRTFPVFLESGASEKKEDDGSLNNEILQTGNCCDQTLEQAKSGSSSESETFENASNQFVSKVLPECFDRVKVLTDVCDSLHIPYIRERSSSGNGVHIWFFFETALSAAKARMFGNLLIEYAKTKFHLKKLDTFDRMFPNQDELKEGGLGNLIALPLQGQALLKGNSAFVDSGWNIYPDQYFALSHTSKITETQLDKWISQLDEQKDPFNFSMDPAVSDSLASSYFVYNGPFNGASKSGKRKSASKKAGLSKDQLSLFGNDSSQPIAGESVLAIDQIRQNRFDLQSGKSFLFHSEDVNEKVLIIVEGEIMIYSKTMKPRMANQIRRMASYPNAQYYTKLNSGMNTKGMSRSIDLAVDENGWILLPRALLDDLKLAFECSNIPYSLVDHRSSGIQIQARLTAELTDIQKPLFSKLSRYSNGIFLGATGSGKTIAGLYLISLHQVNTLIVVENKNLLSQWEERIHEFLDIETEEFDLQEFNSRQIQKLSDQDLNEKEIESLSVQLKEEDLYTMLNNGKRVEKAGMSKAKKKKTSVSSSVPGVVSGNSKKFSGVIDIVTSKSLLNLIEKYGRELTNLYGMIIFDECHHAASPTGYSILASMNPKYVYGFTGTLKREDKLEKSVIMQIGPVRAEFSAKEQAAEQSFERIVHVRPIVNLFSSSSSSEDMQKLYSIQDFQKSISENKERNKLILDDIKKAVLKKRSILVLTKFIDHSKWLFNQCAKLSENTFLINGQIQNKELQKILSQIRKVSDSDPLIVVGTGQSIGEGFDLPRLDTLFITLPQSSDKTISQYLGRLARDYDKKERVEVYDYNDIDIPQLHRMHKKRLSIYARNAYKVCCEEKADFTMNKALSVFRTDQSLKLFEQDIAASRSSIEIYHPSLKYEVTQYFIRLIKNRRMDLTSDEKSNKDGLVLETEQTNASNGLSAFHTQVILKDLNSEEFDVSWKNKVESFYKEEQIDVKTSGVENLSLICIDDSIIWYGTIDPETSEDYVIRIQDPAAVQELKNAVMEII